MSKGENIFKRKDGRWEARYVKGRDLSGKIKYGFCYGKSYKEAKEKVNKAKARMLSGKAPFTQSVKRRFDTYCDEWLQNSKKHLKSSTFVKYDTILRCHIKPCLGRYHPLAITSELTQAFCDELLNERGLSPKTVKDILVVLQSVIKHAEKQHPELSYVKIIYPKSIKKEMRVLTRDEEERFVAYLQKDMDSCKFGILLALFTGMRIGEICALKWEMISKDDRAIRISATMQRLRDHDSADGPRTKLIIGPPKSDMSMRIIPLTDIIFSLCEKMRPMRDSSYILTGTALCMEPRTLQYRLKKYTNECGLDGVHFHTLRHTFATRCVEVGFEIKSLSEILGHASTTITLDRYVHSSIQLKRDNMEKLEIGSL